MRAMTFVLAVSTLALAACQHESAETAGALAPAGATARATLADAAGAARGDATAADVAGGIEVRVTATGMTPGIYGIHLHGVGACEGPKFTSAGPHWNPAGKLHGTENPMGAHMGDLPNLTIGADGAGTLDFTIAGVAVAGGATPLLDADGASLMIHAKPDDYKTDPSGASGDRIVCGVFAAG